jgi:hypothetical protein
MTSRVEAIVSLKPGAEFSMSGDTLTWIDSKQTKPTNAEIDAEITRLDNLYTAEKYKRDRTTNGSTTYDTVGNQLDMLYADLVAGKLDATGKWAKHIKSVKDANPKP